MTTMFIIDRRLNPGGKSLENFQRFKRRVTAATQKAVRDAAGGRNVADITEGGEISIPADGIQEPRFHRSGGKRSLVLTGNKKFVVGDVLPRPKQGSAKGSGTGEGDSEDAFRFVLSRDEFAELFLEDLELPDLARKKLAEVEHEGLHRAGYQTSGSPAAMSISKTMTNRLKRQVALKNPHLRQIKALEEELQTCEDEERRLKIQEEIALHRLKANAVHFIEEFDIRYRRFEPNPKRIAQAVMFCLMDVSGSMSEHMKDLAKRFYMLLYVFLTRRYTHVEIVFIRHTDKAEEVDEQTFFHGPASGGTKVSSALECMRQSVKDRFNPSDWNIYVANASDGDNLSSDGEAVRRLMSDYILPITQFFAYIEVANESSGMHGFHGPNESELWTAYDELREKGASIAMRKVSDRKQIFPVFHQLFQRKGEKNVA